MYSGWQQYKLPFITLARYKPGVVLRLPVSEKMLRPMLLLLLLAVVISVTETQYSGNTKQSYKQEIFLLFILFFKMGNIINISPKREKFYNPPLKSLLKRIRFITQDRRYMITYCVFWSGFHYSFAPFFPTDDWGEFPTSYNRQARGGYNNYFRSSSLTKS